MAALCAGCSLYTKATVGVHKIGPDAVQAKLGANAISGDEPSTFAVEALHSLDLVERFRKEPDEALRLLHRTAVEEKDHRLLYALAELSYAAGRQLNSRSHFLAAAIYAYCYLFDDRGVEATNPFDRRQRWACDLYNLGLERALVPVEVGSVELASLPRELPVGTIDVVLDRSGFPWSEEQFPRFLPADDFDIFGLSLRYRTAGLGVPLIGLAPERPASKEPATPTERFTGNRPSVPATAFLRFEPHVEDLERGIAARLELHSGYDVPETTVDGRKIPLESDLTAPIAYSLDANKALWEFSLSGFFGTKSLIDENRLVMVRPFEHGRIPVVFVHGTASTPAYWAEMFNTLQADPLLRDSMQFWFFIYKTGNPIPYSSATLRDQLNDAIRSFDPDGKDPALHHIVVIGHSQGGLLARMLATDGSIDWLTETTGTKLEDFHFTPEQEKLVRWALDFDPVPQVDRLVFMCTPHRGSFLAERPLSRFMSSLISLPSEIVDLGPKLVSSQKGLPDELKTTRVGTSLDNMDSKNRFLKRLGKAPIAPGVTTHSIIARDGGDTLEESDDGVVEYKSAHLDGVESEFIVPSRHSCQSHPLAIREVRRILLEHVRSAAIRRDGDAGARSN